jgi:hypothetical protein
MGVFQKPASGESLRDKSKLPYSCLQGLYTDLLNTLFKLSVQVCACPVEFRFTDPLRGIPLG